MSGAREIAAKLTEAQKRVLIDGTFSCQRTGSLRARGHKTPKRRLCRLKLLNDYLGAPYLTTLGIEVRAILQENPQNA